VTKHQLTSSSNNSTVQEARLSEGKAAHSVSGNNVVSLLWQWWLTTAVTT